MLSIRARPLLSAAPRAYLFTSSRSPRSFTTTSVTKSQGNPFETFGGPAPPRLPREDQEIFEELQRQSTGAFSTPRAPPKINQSPDATATDIADAGQKIEVQTDKMADSHSSTIGEEFRKTIEARGKGEELHPNVRLGAKPEFEGEKNPKTGEVGGPKNEPLRWGPAGEWTYNGRTTDF